MNELTIDFIKKQALSKASAAAEIASPLDINGIYFNTNCHNGEIHVTGLKKLAEILELPVNEEIERPGCYKQYISINGCTFYENIYREENKKTNDTEAF